MLAILSRAVAKFFRRSILLLLLASASLNASRTLANEPVHIAVVGPSSGPAAEKTKAIAEGARRSLEAVKTRLGLEFTFETADDGCTRAKAEEAAKALVSKNVALVLGHPCTGAALAAARIYAVAGIVFIATETRHAELTANRAGPSIFRLAGNDSSQGDAAAAVLLAEAGDKPVAVVHDRTLYAKTVAEAAVKALKAAKKEPVTATIIAGDKEYGKLIEKIKGAGAVLFAGFPLEAGFIAGALRRKGSAARFLGSDSIATDEFASSFAAEAKNARVLLPRREDSAKAAEAAVQIFADALQKSSEGTAPSASGRLELAKIAVAIVGNETETVLGKIHFDKNGDADLPSYDVVQWDGAAWIPVSARGR